MEDFISVDDEEDDPEPQTGPTSSSVPATASAKKWPRVMFEFDVHFGFLPAVDTIISQTSPSGIITTHTQSVDHFDVKRDINRLEIGTDKFALSPKGLEKIETVKTNIAAFVAKLATGCSAARRRTDVRVVGLEGHPRLFPLPDASASAGSAVIHKLPNKKRFPTTCGVWASPQAHITIPLAKVGELVSAIKNSIGKPDGKALTGFSPQRMGLRSDHLFKAKAAVEALRTRVIAAGHTLSSGVTVGATTFTDDLAGLLILQGSYLWVRDLAEPADYERWGKGHLPINVKTPFSEIFTDILTDTEREIYKEILAGPTVRTAMFGLVRRLPSFSDGSTKLFPDVVFSSFTWDDLLDLTLGTKSVSGLPGGGKVWPASKTEPRVALELRRIGFKGLGASKWNTLIDTIVVLTKKLNGL